MYFHSKNPRANVNKPNTFPREKIPIVRLASFGLGHFCFREVVKLNKGTQLVRYNLRYPKAEMQYQEKLLQKKGEEKN
jgi:hypothetical protein